MSRFRFLRALLTALVGFGALTLTLTPSGVAVADETGDVENFGFSSWDLSYEIYLDEQGRAHAEVTEELVAQFPDFDQNRGIVRALPLRYQGAPAAPEDITVTDGDGAQVPFETEDDGGFRSVLVGDDSFVHGEQTYEISYTLADVMHATDEADEFYWDLVPVDRSQDIDAVSAEITLDSQLSAATTGSAACYLGTPDESQACSISTTEDAEAVFTVEEDNLPEGQGLTAAIGVEPGTVTQPQERQENFVLDWLPLLLVGAAALLGGAGALAIYRMVSSHRTDRNNSALTYGLPDGMNPLIARQLTGASQNPVVPAILDLAVRGVLRIDQPDGDSRWYRSTPKPTLHLLDPQLATDPLERQLLEGLFPGLQPGEEFTFPKHDKVFTKAAQKTLQETSRAVVERGLVKRARHRGATLAGGASLVLLIPVIILVIMGVSRDNIATTAISIVLGGITAMLAGIAVFPHRVHTPEGAATRAQLMRVREMIRVSEGERLELMQSYPAAVGSPSRGEDPSVASVVQVYDQLLPYAVLFGLQKDWAKVLSNVYHQHHVTAPLWYPALFAHGSQGIESSLSSMLNSVSSAAGTASSGAGSAGGGAAGAGGGGGAAGGR